MLKPLSITLIIALTASTALAETFNITSGSTTNAGNNFNGSDTVNITGALNTGSTFNEFGIKTDGDKNTIILSTTGSIITAGIYADGIVNSGDDTVTTVLGNISTTGDRSSGIVSYGGGNSTTVSGTITTSGVYSPAIDSLGTGISNTVSVTGSITTTGTGSSGVRFVGPTSSATISGTINSSGTDSSALINNGGGSSFQLNEGAIIIGDILAYGDSSVTKGKLIFNLGEGTSYAYSVSGNGSGTGAGQWTFSDLDGRTQGISTTGSGCNLSIEKAFTTTCNLVTAVTPGNIEAQSELQYVSNRSFINSLNFGLAKDRSSGKGEWLEAYGDKADRDASTTNATAFALDANSSGLTFGKPLKFGENLNLDLIFNGSSTDLNIGTTKDQKITSKSYNLGLVLNNLSSSDNWNVNAFGFVGNNSYDGKRKVMNNQVSTGSETVTSSYSGTELLLGFNAGYNNAITDNLSFIANLNANLSYETIGAYSESKYYSWDKRDLTQTAAGLKVGLNYTKNSFSTFATVGTDFNSLQDGNKATYKNNGTAVSYTDTEDGDTFGTASFGISYKAENGPTFTAGIDGFSSSKGLSGNTANVSLDWAF